MGICCVSREGDPQDQSQKPLPFDRKVSDCPSDKHNGVRKNYIVDTMGKITDIYDLDTKSQLGEGAYGTVCKGVHKKEGFVRAVKSIAKKSVKDLAQFKNEVDIMKMMDHPNIIRLFEDCEDHRNVYLVTELCSGGELFDRIVEVCQNEANPSQFTEVQAATLMKQIMLSVFYLHSIKVAHRDLKPENFLFQDKGPIETSVLKLIDFGLSKTFDKGKPFITKAGTSYYVAPEVLGERYTQTCDVWSCGVIMYVLLCGYPPFFGDTDKDVLRCVKRGKFSFPEKEWGHVSQDAKDLIGSCLQTSVQSRYSAEQALHHIWIENTAPTAAQVPLQASFVDNLRSFKAQNKLKKAALTVIASRLDAAQITQLKDIFMMLDKDGDGHLTHSELKEGLSKSGLQDVPEDLKKIMEDVDADGSGEIDYTEFLTATLDKQVYTQENLVWSAFRMFDKNGDGKISREELELALGDGSIAEATGIHNIDEILKDVDTNGDGEIDFDEFTAMMHKQ